MTTGVKFAKLAGMAFLCLSCLSVFSRASAHTQRKTKKPALAPLPNGPTGPVPQIPLDSMASVPPQVTYHDGQLTIIAANSTLADILRAVKKQTGADIEVPSANDRVVTHLGPGSAREVIADLLNGSRFNYVLLGSPQDSKLLTRVVLVTKTGDAAAPVNAQMQPQQPGPMQAGNAAPQLPPEEAAEAMENPEVAEDNPEDNPDQSAADAEQQQAEQANQSPDQQGVKTPQQMLQEMQQRQLQMQQQQQQGQVPGLPVPGRPPQEQ
jgi:hypothetical protein